MGDCLVVPSITTHSKCGSTWRDKIAEVLSLKVPQVGLFLTGLSDAERKECYRLLLDVREQHNFSIPFVHAVSRMEDAEYTFLRYEFGTRWFNLHSQRAFPLEYPLSEETKRYITIENANFSESLTRQDLEGFAGICIDLSHLEEARLIKPAAYNDLMRLCSEIRVCANHISAIVDTFESGETHQPQCSSHYLGSEREVQYLNSMPHHVVGEVAALELENPLHEQLQLLRDVTRALASAHCLPRSAAA
jgi:hypothetical protein